MNRREGVEVARLKTSSGTSFPTSSSRRERMSQQLDEVQAEIAAIRKVLELLEQRIKERLKELEKKAPRK